MSAPLDLFALIRKTHQNDAWVHINPMFATTLRLALRARLVFDEDDMVTIAHDYSAGYWHGRTWEDWYALAIDAHKSAAPAFEKMMGRKPFMLDGERVYVGKRIAWQDSFWCCTSIEADFIRVKRDVYQQPATLIQIPREGFEAKIAADKAKATAKRAAERETERADPVTLLPLSKHFASECGSTRGRWGGGTYVNPEIIEWAKGYDIDYKRAWQECNRGWWMSEWLNWLGVCSKGLNTNDADVIRKKYSWPKVEQAIFRLARKHRGLPLRDAKVEVSDVQS